MANNDSQLSTSSLLSIQLATCQKTMRDLHVASMGVVVSYNDDGTYNVSLLPKRQDEDENTTIICDSMIDELIPLNSVVIVIFLDRASRVVFQQLKKTATFSTISKLSTSEQDILHSLSYGVIIYEGWEIYK